jgi:hypothetical protein
VARHPEGSARTQPQPKPQPKLEPLPQQPEHLPEPVSEFRIGEDPEFELERE